jgi:hypothetical protein
LPLYLSKISFSKKYTFSYRNIKIHENIILTLELKNPSALKLKLGWEGKDRPPGLILIKDRNNGLDRENPRTLATITKVCLVVGQLGRDRPLTSSLVPPILRDNRGQHRIVLPQPLTQNQTT